MRDHRNYFLARANKLLVENSLASMLRIHSFSAHYAVLLTENNIESISAVERPYGKRGHVPF